MYKEYLHTLMSVVMLCYCCIVYLVDHLRYIELFFMSRRNTTVLSKVGEMGVGKQGISQWFPCARCEMMINSQVETSATYKKMKCAKKKLI